MRDGGSSPRGLKARAADAEVDADVDVRFWLRPVSLVSDGGMMSAAEAEAHLEEAAPDAPAALAGWPAAALLDAMPDATAVLSQDGTIVAVNRAWRMFALDNGGDPTTTGVGVNYLQVCTGAAGAGSEDAAAAATRMRAVLEGDCVEQEFEYACSSRSLSRWFVLRATLITGPQRGLLVAHLNVSRRKASERALEQKASQDPLTGIANRLLLTERLASALTRRAGRTPQPDVGVLYVDLDGFKPINDTYGHAAGDEVLQTVATRLAGELRPQDTVARLGGDEFVAIATRITPQGLAGLVDRICRALERPHLVHGRRLRIGASVGAFLAGPGDTVEGSLQRADEATYEVKQSRRRPRAALAQVCPYSRPGGRLCDPMSDVDEPTREPTREPTSP